MKKQSQIAKNRQRSRPHLVLATLAVASLVCAASAPAIAQTIAPPFSGFYTLTNLGEVSGVPTNYGGLILKDGDPNTLLIGGSANNVDGAIYSIGIVRDADGHIASFIGTATQFSTAPFIDGGLAYGPSGILFFTTYSDNRLGQIMPGSTVPDKFIDLSALGVTPSTGAVNFVPAGFPGAGGIRIVSYEGGGFYSGILTSDGLGTYDLSGVTLQSTITTDSQAEGFIYVPPGSPGFTTSALLLNEYRNGRVSAFDLDGSGIPIPATRQDFITGLTGAEGAFIDPLTGDFIFNTFGGGNQLVEVRGFVPPPPPPSTLGNISTRLRVETGDNVLIGGFIITGTQPKRIIVRAIGPSLSSFFPGALADPVLELRDSSGSLIRSNDDWRSDQEVEIIATGIPPSNDLESAIVATLPANNSAYTAIVRGFDNGTGIGVVEAYDLDQSVDSKLANISTRGFVQTGDDVMIGGLIVLGQDPLRVIVRAIGPSLSVSGALGDPTLELHDGNGTLIASNDDWRTDQEAEIIATTIPPTNDLESAIVRDLAPGAYTAIVRGVNNATGVALVEVYGLN